MKICFIVGAFPNMKCGVGDYTHMLAKCLSEENDVEIITSSKVKFKNNDNTNRVKVHGIVDTWDYSSKKIILKKISDINPDIVHIQYPSDEYGKSFFINFLPRYIKKRVGCKVVQTVHEYLSYTTKGKLRNLINYKNADNIVVVEKQYKPMIKSFGGVLSKNLPLKYIPISSNIPKSEINDTGISEIRERLNSKECILISFFGFINELKGIETLISSISELIKKGENIKLLILGELNLENEYHKKVLSLIENNNIKDNVIVTGFVESIHEVSDYLKSSDMSILPFRDGVSERNGSFLAAYSQDIPIITTSNELQDFDGVFYVKPGDSKGIVNKYYEVKNSNEKYKRNIISWDDIKEEHIDIYKQGDIDNE
ncbi:glycosyltransferase [Clostridium sp. LY3-2]|uniref:glycosyltransferase n=1 Tax=Clostridium sp. LY3-2 TaxID=2942482 RepID=UPI00215392E4|nr:glycosyltransferase [Clostridium sp. LY3-2]MCR6513734.1 glycosyltransferase [Clostridium sp. LY3-2]